MKTWIGMAAVITALGASNVALAQESVVREADKVEYKKKTIIDFSDVTIQGELTKPEGSYLLNRKKTKFKSLLKLRGNFLPELFNSMDNL
ncbi:MAG: hypothetical protein HY791_18450 [Deltaproteobacteria bacterium]|nr:hypothetical protein [Deltaproteobacteria bacterium]